MATKKTAAKTELVPLCSVSFNATWPRRTRLLWIVNSAAWLRTWIPLVKAAPNLWAEQMRIRASLPATPEIRSEVEGVRKWFDEACAEVPKTIRDVATLWSVALRELPAAVTRPLAALRDGMKGCEAVDDDRALLANLITLEDEARRMASLPEIDKVNESVTQAAKWIDCHDGCTNEQLAKGIHRAASTVAKGPQISKALKALGYRNDGRGKGGWHSPKVSKVARR